MFCLSAPRPRTYPRAFAGALPGEHICLETIGLHARDCFGSDWVAAREEFKPGDLAIADQIIDKTRRPRHAIFNEG